MRRSIATLLFLFLAACTGDPELDVAGGGAALGEAVGPAIDPARWRVAVAGCEGVGGTLALHAAGGEPLLGVLVDGRGAAVCVDSLSLLHRERHALEPVPIAQPDPTPTPVVLGPEEADPTPTPTVIGVGAL